MLMVQFVFHVLMGIIKMTGEKVVVYSVVKTWTHQKKVLLAGMNVKVLFLIGFFIPLHTIVAGYYGFMLDVHVSVGPYFVSRW